MNFKQSGSFSANTLMRILMHCTKFFRMPKR
nr:MAG TPA: hypothetical protein [Caudoviricetes sp.]